jgi:ABC-type branched-subunit amino acid transport system ATPase component/ABC-type branched-subunit amino acid transport system permease subunit
MGRRVVVVHDQRRAGRADAGLPERASVTILGRPVDRRVAITLAVTVVVLVLTRVEPHKVPLGTVLYGVLYGSVNGLLAIGLVLTYRVTRAINFAYGAMGALAAGVGASIYLGHHWPWALVIVFSLVLGAVVGLGVGALINWRFAQSPRLVLTVATVGLSQLLGGMALYVPKYFHGPALIPSFRTSLNSTRVEVRPVLFNGNDLVVLIIVPLVVIGVSWFLLGTDAGRAVRSIADNPDRARLVGIPARRLLLAVWTISGVVAGLAVIIQAPSAGIPLDATAGPAILLPPLAAAVVANMDSLVVAFVAAVGLGVLESVVRLDVSKQSIETAVFLVVILLALLLRHRPESRAEAAEESSWSAGGALRPIPAVLRSLPEVRAVRVVAVAVLVAAALALPVILKPARLDEVSVGLVFALAALSLVVLSGWAGTVSLGQFGIVGIGAIVGGDLMMHLNLDMFVSMLVAGAAGAALALVLGLPALRVRGLYLAVTTLAFAVAANDFFYNPSNFSKELPSSVLRPILWKRFALHGEGDLYLVCVAVLVLAIVLTRGLRQARPGRAILATRDNLRAAEAAAVPTTRVRLTAFMISGIIAGVAGALYVVILGAAGYQTFPPADSITVFAMVVIGGLSSIGGALAGVALIQWIGIEVPKLQLLLSGVGLLVVLMFFPTGLAGMYERVRDKLLVTIARRRGLDTSVWADAADTAVTARPDGERARAGGDAPTSDDGTAGAVLLRCDGVGASYGQLQVLFGIDLTVREGEIVALLGTNGAGKSSLLRSVTGLLPAREGTITFAGVDVTSSATERIVAGGLTMMPGGRGIFPSLTVSENLRVASWPLRRDKSAAEAARARARAMFPVLAQRSHQLAGNLSGGEQQMLSLAMAFLVKPKLLCIDELSLGLAPTIVAKLIDAVRDIHRQGTTIVIVEQSVNVALLLAERAVFLEKGQVRFTGPAADLLDRPDLLRAVFIGGSTPSGPAALSVVSERNGHVADLTEVEPTLVCVGLVKRFGGITAVADVDLEVRPHEIVGLIGHNGAGKTTLFDLICGFLTPNAGRIWINGENVTDCAAYERAVAGLGRSFQEARLFPSLTVAETISVALERHIVAREPFAAAFRMPASTDSEALIASRVEELIEQFGLAAFRHRPTGELSTGTRRIVELACVMAQQPSVLLLDEPSGGVAQAETEALGPLLRRVAAETGCAMVVIEHDMTLLAGLCDRLVALELGGVIAQGPPGEVLSHPEVIASYLGTDATTVARSGRRGRPARRATSSTAPAAVASVRAGTGSAE